jgi:hypothetical protein
LQDNTYRHPRAGWPGRLFAALANCTRFAKVRQAVMSRLPFLTLHSDVRDVVYVSWLVDAAAAQQLLPAGVTLWQRGGKTPFTVLTYRHGHFGPALLGPLRRLLPSPLQSNWRDAVAFLACQDAAIAHVPRSGKLVFGEIDLPVDVGQVQALTAVRADCGLLGQLPPLSTPFAFLVPEVAFKALSERLL